MFLSRVYAKSFLSKYSPAAAVSVDDSKAKPDNGRKQDNELTYYDNSSRSNASSVAAQNGMES